MNFFPRNGPRHPRAGAVPREKIPRTYSGTSGNVLMNYPIYPKYPKTLKRKKERYVYR